MGLGAVLQRQITRVAKLSLLACFAATFPALASDPWTVADLNGDRQPDLITATRTSNSSGGYTYQLNIGLGGPQDASLSFASSYSKIRLSARDVDGDHDADLVVFGAFLPQPIEVWLNDGEGNFRHGDVSKMPVETPARSLENREADYDSTVAASDERNSLSLFCSSVWEGAIVVGAIAAVAPHSPLLCPHLTARGRAPPR